MSDQDFDTDVLVVGSGPAGGAMAALLATYGVRTRMVTKYGWVANSPRAHITNQRAMEVFRDLGVEDLALRDGTPSALMGDTVFATSLTGTEIGRIRTWGTGDESLTEYVAQSPCQMVDLPQTYLEPILLQTAAERGAKVSFDTELIGLTQDEESVTARLRDRATGREYDCRARYLVGADGGRSLVAEAIGLPMEGQMGKAGSMNIVFRADLSELVAHRPSVLYWIMRPGADVGGIGMGLLRMVRPWNEWLIVWGYDIDGEPPEVTDASATAIVRDLVGDPELEVSIDSAALWTVNHAYATEYSRGRVFCGGDAVHRHPPSNGLGSNTSVQDSYNLAWKLAAVLRGEAGPQLLETYSEERAPIGRQIVERANLSRDQFGPLFEALGVVGGDEEGITKALASAAEPSPDGKKKRDAIHEAIELKHYEFNAHGVEHNQRYTSSAVVPDGTQEEVVRDDELYGRPSSRPGAKLPHAWLVEPDGRRVSTLDLVGHGSFTVLTGLSGTAWAEAAEAVARELGVPLRTVVVDRDARDAYGEWHRRSEIEEDGVLLVRPDCYVAWRRTSGAVDAHEATGLLREALSAVLSRTA
ncbi:2,4-dichlorophenol 6-monooxygenase [Nocardioides mangrovicus]|uniref:2,4-dichlorophenol 6-monooxygenase n=1 Tax=Nocardioides mangrovicus TaxID=2478913 RepID=A0A3L8P6B8_9ACTN|nr:FAD-dependent monooxygenase [Nocardioides mangrovicus]RLV50956.1 2,4-dichlorophenol 6-monooxygenase [Nocardioides mangrovicus]